MVQIRQIILVMLTATLLAAAGSHAPKFFPDDPIQAMPTPVPVKALSPQVLNDVFDFFDQSKRRPISPQAAGGVNTVGEVPDSEWFINRHGRHRMTRDELQRGPSSAGPPEPPYTVIGRKTEGIMDGFRIKDSKGRHYFVKTDPAQYPELATGAEAIVSRFLYAIGYNTPANYIVDMNLSDLRGPGKVPRPQDGSIHVVASLAIGGEKIGPFRYEGTRQDDPNDVVPHENRRDLRGLYVFSAWLNNTDAKAGNTLDTIVQEGGIRFIRHYLIDFGSALGSDGDRPKDARFGHEYMLLPPTQAIKQIFKLGLVPSPWEKVRFPKLPAVGNFESQSFDPDCWKPDYPNPAFLNRLPDDDFWAAKQVMAFTDDDIRAIVETARFTDPRSTEYIVATLAERRNKIGQTFFLKTLSLDHFRVEKDNLLFDDLAVQYGFHPPRSYEVHWSAFENINQTHTSIPGSGSTHLPLQATQAPVDSYFSAVIDVPDHSFRPVSVYIRKQANNYKVVGIER
jgi:hypothetical protein